METDINRFESAGKTFRIVPHVKSCIPCSSMNGNIIYPLGQDTCPKCGKPLNGIGKAKSEEILKEEEEAKAKESAPA